MQWLAKHSWKIAVAVMAASMLASIVIAIHAGSQFRYQDEKDYAQLATNLVQRHAFTMNGFEPTASRPPGYVWFLAIPELFRGSNTALRLFNASLLVICQLFVFLLARRVGSSATAAIAVMLSFVYPVFLYTSTVLFPQTLGAALLLCGVWILLDKRQLTAPKALCAGTVWALLILTIPTFLVLAGVLCLWLFWRRRDFRRVLIPFVAPLVILLGGWSLRNYIAFHTPVFIATNGGVNLLIGNSENATGDSTSSVDISRYTVLGHQMSEPQRNKYYTDSAKQWMKEHPREALRLYEAKLIHYFAFADKTTANDRSTPLSDENNSWRQVIMIATYGPLLFLLFARIMLSPKFPMSEDEMCLTGLYFVSALFSAVFFSRIRFRLPMDWLLLVLGAGTIQLIVSGLPSVLRVVIPDKLRPIHDSATGGSYSPAHAEIEGTSQLGS